jgi:metal-responsive CopG/Arc/MetJ family transcriptional regulator
MAKAKIAITMKKDVLKEIDRLVLNKLFLNRSQAIESAAQDMVDRHRKMRLAHECRNLEKAEEQRLAEEGLERDGAEWPEY